MRIVFHACGFCSNPLQDRNDSARLLRGVRLASVAAIPRFGFRGKIHATLRKFQNLFRPTVPLLKSVKIVGIGDRFVCGNGLLRRHCFFRRFREEFCGSRHYFVRNCYVLDKPLRRSL